MQHYFDNVQDFHGNAQAGVSVLVKTAAGAVATIYSDDGVTQKANPLTTAGDGGFDFYAANGKYTLNVGSDVTSITLFDIDDLEDVDTATPTSSSTVLGETAGVVRRFPFSFTQSGTGAVARTVADKLGDFVSVKDFGAVGDGVTDDTAAIQAAIDSGHQKLHFPLGVYLHTGLTISGAQVLSGASAKESGGSILKCVTAGADNITISGQTSFGPVLENLCILGAATSGCGVYINTQGDTALRNVFIYNNGEYGVKIVGHTSEIQIDDCRIQSNTLGGIYGKHGASAQINAVNVCNTQINNNGGPGVELWGNSVNLHNNVIQGNTGHGVKLSYSGSEAGSSIYAYSIKNNYFEAHGTNQIFVETASGQTIIGLEICGNYGYQNTSDAAYRHVKFTSATANEVRSMVYEANAFLSNISLATAVVADFGSRLAADCVIFPYFNYNTSTLTVAQPFTLYENLGAARFESYKSHVCRGVVDSFAGTNISYTTLEKSANITVSGASIFFAPDLPLGALPVALVLGIETDATSHSVAANIYSRALGSTGTFSTVTAGLTMAATNGSVTQTWILNPLTAIRKTATVFEYKLEIIVTLTTPGTYFYLGNPSFIYVG